MDNRGQQVFDEFSEGFKTIITDNTPFLANTFQKFSNLHSSLTVMKRDYELTKHGFTWY